MILRLTLTSLLFSQILHAKVLQEGWYKITASGQHVGYYLQRYEFDEKKSQYVSTSFQKVNAVGGNSSESLKAYADKKLDPVKYEYTSLTNHSTKIIKADFKPDKKTKGFHMEATILDNGKKTVVKEDLEPQTFLSTFLIYRILASNGLKVATKPYIYKAVAEEDAKSYGGEAFVKEMQKFEGKDAFRILTTFKEAKFVNLVDITGRALSTRAPADGIDVVAVGTRAAAVGKIPFSDQSIRLVFGTLPPDQETADASPGKKADEKADGKAADQDSGKDSVKDASDLSDAQKTKNKKLFKKPEGEVPPGVEVPPGKNPVPTDGE